MPLGRQIQPFEARELIEQNLKAKLELVELPAEQYNHAIDRVCRLGLVSSAVYDALHLEAAEAIGCESLKTYNLRHFQKFHPESVIVSAP